MNSPLRSIRQIVAPGPGRHRPRPAAPVLTAPDPDANYLPCHSLSCGHMTTRHDEITEDEFRCRKCGHVTTGGA